MGLLPIFRTAELRRVESAARGQPLMERAGLAAADVARTMLGDRGGSVLVLAGRATTAAMRSSSRGGCARPSSTSSSSLRGDAAKLPPTRRRASGFRRRRAERRCRTYPADGADRSSSTGCSASASPVRSPAQYAAQVEYANASGVPILALDIPSGIDADTGVAHGVGHPRRGDGDVHRAEARIADGRRRRFLRRRLGPFARARARSEAPPCGHRLDWSSLAARSPGGAHARGRATCTREPSARSRSSAAPTAWSARRCSPAARRCMPAPARCGSDWPPASPPAVDWGQPELMLRTRRRRCSAAEASAIVCGPGLGVSSGSEGAASRERSPSACRSCSMPMRSTRLRRMPRSPRPSRKRDAPTIATPHPAEAGRLLGTDDRRRSGGPARRRAGARRQAARKRRRQRRRQRARPSRRHVGHQCQRQRGPRERGHRRRARGLRRSVPRAGDRREDCACASPCACTARRRTRASSQRPRPAGAHRERARAGARARSLNSR